MSDPTAPFLAPNSDPQPPCTSRMIDNRGVAAATATLQQATMKPNVVAKGEGVQTGDMKESQRALELRKFFAPDDQQPPIATFDEGFNKSLNDDGALDAYAESLVWRLRGVHAMVSLVDRGTQYFLGGAVRKKQPGDETEVDDVITTGEWFGCSSVPTPGGLCENTISLDPAKIQYPCFIVNDLSQDPRFASLPVVDGTISSYRFYAGTPITTDHGINIGSVFIFDDKPREGMALGQRKFLHQQASNVMRHLETKREAAERRRAALMSKGIARFLERTSLQTSNEDDIVVQEDETLASQSQGKADVTSSDTNKDPESSDAVAKESVLDKIRFTHDQAAEILRDSLELNVGGVVFLDTARDYSDSGNTEAYLDSTTDIGSHVEVEKQEEKRRAESRGNNTRPSVNPDAKPFRISSPESSRASGDEHKAARVLAMSAAREAAWDRNANVLDAKTLQSLTNTYPKGNVWYTDEEGFFSSLEQTKELQERPNISPSGRRQSIDSTHKKAEATMLARIFKRARQIIFLPLWDAGGNRWYSGCFVWSQSAVPVFTVDSEIAYLTAFTNSVMVEISRLDAITSNKMKSDFISSISHEFRSPLHGILASAELLRESSLDTSQMEFIATIQNCSGTLLDTINHVLDYSKINSFEKKGNEQGTISNELIQVTNLALLCEDIINGMIAAREFHGVATDDPLSVVSREFRADHLLKNDSSRPILDIILDIEQRDWYYNIQAGALRRVVMNIFGNAQKYTESGHIMIKMRIQEDKPHSSVSPRNILLLEIKDSGRGMSTEYMERKLYHPFSQEDTFAPGVGLGLSIVRSIVNQLGGQISIRSQLGKGTIVEITMPIDKAEAPAPYLEPGDTKDILLNAQKCIVELQSRAAGKSIQLSRIHTNTSKPKDISWACIKKYCTEWFGFTMSEDTGDLIITDHNNGRGFEAGQRVLVVHDEMSNSGKHVGRYRDCAIGHIYPPVGPFRLARCLLALLVTDLSRSEYESSPHPSLADRSTQTPLGSPEERTIMNGIILTDYGFTAAGSTLSGTTISSNSGEDEKKDEPAQEMQVQEEGVDDDKTPPAPTSILGQLSQLTLEQKNDTTTPPRPGTNSPLFGELRLPQPKSPILTTAPLPSAPTSTTPNPPTEALSPGTPSSKPTPKSLHILAVDDNALNLQLLHRYLLKRKFDTIVLARDGLEAVTAVKDALGNEKRFDVVFMDISMPNMNGFEATRAIRAIEREFLRRSLVVEEEVVVDDDNADEKGVGGEVGTLDGIGGRKGKAFIVATTGLASKRDREEAEGSGFDDFLTKPISFGKIGELLKKLT